MGYGDRPVVGGRKVRLYYSGSNPSNTAVTIYKEGQSNVSDTIAANEQLVVTAFDLITTTGGAFRFLSGDGSHASLDIAHGTLPSTGGGLAQSYIDRRCKKGDTPRLTAAAAGQTDLCGEGYIIKQNT
jgi:hypothetical protein